MFLGEHSNVQNIEFMHAFQIRDPISIKNINTFVIITYVNIYIKYQKTATNIICHKLYEVTYMYFYARH